MAIPRRLVGYLAVVALALPTAAVELRQAAGGLLFEAEAYDGHLRGDGFGQPVDEPFASGGRVLIGLWKGGLIGYRLQPPAAGEYHLWLRYAAPGDASLTWGLNTLAEAELTRVPLPQTSAVITNQADAYQWARLATVALTAEEQLLVVGQGAVRPDAFWLTTDPIASPPADLAALAGTRQVHGPILPELVHDRVITRRPKWLDAAVKVCYAHYEWDPSNTPESWSRRAREAGATCLVGVGEMPAGAVDGKLRRFNYSQLAQPDFQLPANYDLSYRWVKEMVDAGHAEGLQVVIYGGAFRTLDPLLVEHPDWRQQDATGRPYAHGFGSWHSPYRQAYIDRWVKVARDSGLDGIMIDMLFTGPRGGDYSPWTVAAFKERFGHEPPREMDHRDRLWQRWIDFQRYGREQMLLELTEALHAVNPECAVIVNQTDGWIYSRPHDHFLTTRVARCVDGLLEEMGWEIRHGNSAERPWAWPISAAWQSLFLHCRTRPGYGQMWHLTQNFPAVHAEALSYAMLAGGVAPAVVTGGNWPEMTRIWQHIAGCQPHVGAAATLEPWLAIHFGEDTRDWYANAGGEETRNAWLKNVFGLFQTALELHLPVAIITDDDLADPHQLADYRVVVLPDSACLSDAQVAALTAYVEGGSGLLATFQTGRFDQDGALRDRPALADLCGATALSPARSNTWRVNLADLFDPIFAHPDIETAGDWRQGFVERSGGANLAAGPASRTIGAVPTTNLAEDVLSVRLQGSQPPAGALHLVHRRNVGTGRVAFVPLDLGHAYYVFNHPVGRRLIGQLAEWAAGSAPPLRTTAPMTVQSVVYRQDEARLVHLVNDISSFGRAAAPNPEAFTAFRSEVIPVHGITVAVPGRFEQARWLPSGDTLPVAFADGWSQVVVPRLEIHGLLVFQP